MTLALIVGIGIVAFGVLYLGFLLDKKDHLFFRFISIFVFVSLLLLIPKVTFDERIPCEFKVNHTRETFIYGNNYTGYHWDYSSPSPSVQDVNLFHKNTTYQYDYVCATNHEKTTPENFFIAYNTYSVIFIVYFFIYFIYMFFIKKGNMIDKLMRRSRK